MIAAPPRQAPAPGESPRIAAILLAAGRSRRMGAVDKRLLPVVGPDGVAMPMVRHAAGLYLGLGLDLTVVVEAGDSPVVAALAGLPVRLVACPLPPAGGSDDGQQGSVRAGLGAAPGDADGVLIALADQPLLTGADVTELIAAFAAAGGGRAVIPSHAGQRGNPVIVPGAVARALRDAAGAPSVRGWLDAHPDRVAWHEANDHFTRDVDTPADAAALLAPALTGGER